MALPKKTTTTTANPLEIAIIGGGIVGVQLAIGLAGRGVRVKMYEQARGFGEIGAGLSMSPNGVRAMGLVDARIVDAYRRLATVSGDPGSAVNTFNYMDGFTPLDDDVNGVNGSSSSSSGNGTADSSSKKFANIRPLMIHETPQKGHESLYRVDFMNALVKLVPSDSFELNKRLEKIEDNDNSRKVLLTFSDGSTTEADAVIGCDGIKSTVKRLLLGDDNPASRAHYTHVYAFRGVVPMSDAEAAVGRWLARNRVIMTGPDAHFVAYPIANQTSVNLVGMVADGNDWPLSSQLTARSSKAAVVAKYAKFNAAARALAGLVPGEGDEKEGDRPVAKWAMFDTAEHPAPTYARGRVAIAGDAAHASSPHHGAGLAMGLEDVAALVGMVPRALERLGSDSDSDSNGGRNRAEVVAKLLAAYDGARRERSQWVVASSRWCGELFQWRNADFDDYSSSSSASSDWTRARAEHHRRSHVIWDYDVAAMVDDAVADFDRRLDALSEGTKAS